MGGGTYWRRYGAYVIRALTALISIQKLINCAILERGAARRGALYQIITGKLKIDDINPQFINKYTWVLINKSSYTVVCSMQNPLATLTGKHIIVDRLRSQFENTVNSLFIAGPLTYKRSDWVSMKEFLWWKIKAFPLGDHFITSWNLFSWSCSDIVRRKLMLVKIAGGERL